MPAKIRKAKMEDTKSVLSESANAHTADFGYNSADKESCSPSQNGNHIPGTGNSRDQSNHLPENVSVGFVTETKERNISAENCVTNEVLASDEGNFEQNELQDSVLDFKQQSNDEMHIARARGLFPSTNLPNKSSSPANQAPYGLNHHGDSPSSISGSDSENLPFNWRNDSTASVDTLCSDAVRCQSKEVVQDSENVNHENDTNYESSSVAADESLIKRKRKTIVAIDHASMPVKGECGLDIVEERASTFGSPASEEMQSIREKSSSPGADGSAYEFSYADVIPSQSSKIAEHSQKSSPNGYVTKNRTPELEATAATDPSSSELSGGVGKMSVSATTKSGHGYDGSISSYEDQDDQIYKQTFRDVNYVENGGKENLNTSKVSSLIAMQRQAREFFSSEKNHKTMHESSWSPLESGEFMRHQTRKQTGLATEIYPSGGPFNTRGYENGGPSSDFFDGVRSDSSIYSVDPQPYTEKERIELLKMVHELQEELNRTPANTGNFDRRNLSQFWNGRQMPLPHVSREFMDEADLQSKYSRHPFTRSEQGTNWPRQPNHSGMPFSGEVTNHRHHDEYSCQHRQPVDRHFSAQLAPSGCSVCSLNTGLQRVHFYSGEQFRNPYSSSTSSPQRHMESDFPSRVRDVTYGDPRLMERYVEASIANSSIASKDEMKFYAREKQLRVRHHIRTIAGGAPFISCNQCWSLLQLPADSFLFKRRHHELKCGSCSKILKFSLEDRTHLVPYVHDYRAPPPTSELKGRDPVNNGTSHVDHSSHSHGIQTSCSDHEFGNSFSRSFSTTEGKQEFLAAQALAAQASNANSRKASSGCSSDILEGRKKRFSKQLFSKDKRPMETPETSSTNKTFNIENYSSESRAGSPLHKLMGYTSISQVFRGPSKGTSESFRNRSAR
ncbi:hypothetical protein QQ045_031970 [Rhodiola kirilowii]